MLVGNTLIPQGALSGGASSWIRDRRIRDRQGPCAPVVDTSVPDGSVTDPSGHGDARVLGIADLMVLEQTLSRYQLGEISHIENVLKSEVRSRTFRTKDTSEQTDTTQNRNNGDQGAGSIFERAVRATDRNRRP